jgi:hypothetical protein
VEVGFRAVEELFRVCRDSTMILCLEAHKTDSAPYGRRDGSRAKNSRCSWVWRPDCLLHENLQRLPVFSQERSEDDNRH